MSRLIPVVLAMAVLTVCALAVDVGASGAARAADEDDMTRQAAMAERFAPFDEKKGSDWEPAFDFPTFRSASVGEVDSSTVMLKPGAYRVVVLCNCTKMEVALFKPDGQEALPDRSNDQAAMYALDVPNAGQFLVGVQMQDCPEDHCDYAFKTYRKKP